MENYNKSRLKVFKEAIDAYNNIGNRHCETSKALNEENIKDLKIFAYFVEMISTTLCHHESNEQPEDLAILIELKKTCIEKMNDKLSDGKFYTASKYFAMVTYLIKDCAI